MPLATTSRTKAAALTVGGLLFSLPFSLSPAKAQVTTPAETASAVSGGYLPLRQQLSRLLESSGTAYSADKDMPNSRLFIAVAPLENSDANNQQEFRSQVLLLLNGPQWQYLWKDGTVPKEEKQSFLLARHAITDAERREALIKNTNEQIKYLAGLVKDWPAQRGMVMQEDKDTADHLNAPFVRNGISLANTLAPEQIAQALSGQKVEMPVTSLSDEQIGFLYEYAGGGLVQSKEEMRSTGTFCLKPRIGPDGQPIGFYAEVYTTDKNYTHGSDPLDVPHYDDSRLEFERQKVANVALGRVSRKDRVTIPWNLPTASPDEPPLAAYLRAIAEQTGLTILGRFPDPKAQTADTAGKTVARFYNRRLSASIINKPIGEALNTLCSVYQSFWILDKPVNPAAGVTATVSLVVAKNPNPNGPDRPSKTDQHITVQKQIGHIIRFWAYVVTPAALPKPAAR